jgi:hypothetical protein
LNPDIPPEGLGIQLCSSGVFCNNAGFSYVVASVGDYSITGTQTVSANPGAQAKANLQLTSTFSYGGKINATCDASSLPGAMCILTPANPLTLASGGTMSLTATINVPDDANANQ